MGNHNSKAVLGAIGMLLSPGKGLQQELRMEASLKKMEQRYARDADDKKRMEAALSKLDWDKMSSHFQSKESAEAFNNLYQKTESVYFRATVASREKDPLSVSYDRLYKRMAAKELVAKQKLFSSALLTLLNGLMFSLMGLYAWKEVSDMKREYAWKKE